jgi:hypothetical protein
MCFHVRRCLPTDLFRSCLCFIPCISLVTPPSLPSLKATHSDCNRGRIVTCHTNAADFAGITSVAELLLPGLGEAIAVGRNDGLVQVRTRARVRVCVHICMFTRICASQAYRRSQVYDVSEGEPLLTHQAVCSTGPPPLESLIVLVSLPFRVFSLSRAYRVR